jgi:Domain of unknown function (DUF222)
MFDLLDDLETVVDKLAASELPGDVARLTRVIERLEYQRLRAVRDLDRSGRYVDDDCVTAASWLRHRTRLSAAQSYGAVRLARALDDLPETAVAFEAGAIAREHARAIADACTRSRAGAIQELEPQLIAAARVVDPREFRALLSQVADALDGDDGAATASDEQERAWFDVAETFHGMWAVNGMLDRETGASLRATLDAAMDPPRAGDRRTASQRRAEALALVCDAARPNLADGPGRAKTPHAVIHLDVEAIERRGGPVLVERLRSDIEHGGRLSKATMRRLTCDASISRVITDGRSQVIDVGRQTKVIPKALWRALVARDGGCVAPGCDRPPGWCDVHHEWHWIDGGPTNPDNCELRCRRHHRAVHEGCPGP